MKRTTKYVISATILSLSQFTFAYDEYFDFNGDGVLTIQDIEDLDEADMLSSERLESLFITSAPTSLSEVVSPGDFLQTGEYQEYQGYPIGRINTETTNDVMNQIWGGKTFYKGSNGSIRIDNRALPLVQDLLGVTSPVPVLGDITDGISDAISIDAVDADVYNISSSSFDNEPAVLLDYSESEAITLSSIRDEIRLIEPSTNLYIGRANIEIGYGTLEYSESVLLINTINTLLINGHNCKEEMGGEYIKGGNCFALWFFLQPKED